MDTAIQVIIQVALLFGCCLGIPSAAAALTWHLLNRTKK